MAFPLPPLPEVSEIVSVLRGLSNLDRYANVNIGCFQVMIRLSVVKRREGFPGQEDVLDFDIVQIQLPDEYTRRGLGSEFFLRFADACYVVGKRGAYLESAITPGSMGMMQKLCKRGSAFPCPARSGCFLSVYPPTIVFLAD